MKIDIPEKRRVILEAVRNNPEMPSRTLARMLFAKYPLFWRDLDGACMAVRHRRGNMGDNHRGRSAAKELHRPNQPAGFRWTFPESLAETWEPYNLDTERNLILSDLHIPFHDTPALQAVVKFAKGYRPQAIILNGDICDFFSLSRFDKDPTKTKLLDEVEACRNFLGWLRDQFPKSKIVFKCGNHDERFAKYIWAQAPFLWGIAAITLENVLLNDPGREVRGIEWIGDQRRIKAGHLTILHGHELGRGSIAPPINPARGAFMKTLECTLVGHLHRASHHPETTMNGRLISCWSTGCLCGLWPDYAKVNKWTHGAATVDLHKDNFSVSPISILNGKIL